MITRPIPAVVTAFVPLCLQFYDGAVPAMDTIEYDSRNEDDDGHIWMLAGNGKGGQVRQKPFVIQTIITVPSSKLFLFGPYTGLRRIRCCWFRVPRQKHRGIRVERWQCHLPIRMPPCLIVSGYPGWEEYDAVGSGYPSKNIVAFGLKGGSATFQSECCHVFTAVPNIRRSFVFVNSQLLYLYVPKTSPIRVLCFLEKGKNMRGRILS